MRIAYVVTRSDSVGGASIHVRDMAQAMLARGHEALVLLGGQGPVTAQLESAGVPYQQLRYLGRPVRPFRDVRAFFELTAALRDFAPDLVSTHTAKAGWLGRAASARLGLPSIYTPHGWPCGDRMPAVPRFFFGWAERAASRWGKLIICVSAHERELALERKLAAPGRLIVIHNGVRDIELEFRADPGRSPVRIVSVARLDKPKDHATLLTALANLQSLDWELELVGEGPLENGLRALAGRMGIAGRVRFAGYLPDHWVGTGYRVTPVVGFVHPAYELRLAAAEVHDVFEVPLNFILDEANHKARERNLGGVVLQTYDIPYGNRNIWGATAGMLLTLRRQLRARAENVAG